MAKPSSPPSSADSERIAKFLARAGVCSRRDAERLIAEGRIKLNGQVLDTPATKVSAADKIMVDGRPISVVFGPTEVGAMGAPFFGFFSENLALNIGRHGVSVVGFDSD